MARLGSIIFTLFLMGAVGAFVAVRWLQHEITVPNTLAAEKLVVIAPGTSVKGITAQLLEEGVIQNKLAFLADARWQNRKKELKAGEYKFTPGMTIEEVILLLQSGKTYQHSITIPEGLTVTEITGLLVNEPALTGDVSEPPPEGSLLPETYKFSRGDTRQSMINRMQKAMQEELDILWNARAPDFNLARDEVVVLASIVEKETGVASERPRVAGVFTNRLRKSIALQSDPTVIYALTHGKTKLERPLTYADLKTPSAFNTYIATGLPPSPIANPGRASLAAVLNPEKNDYIYFVADGTGGHAFAVTLKEHNNNVSRWRKLQKSAN